MNDDNMCINFLRINLINQNNDEIYFKKKIERGVVIIVLVRYAEQETQMQIKMNMCIQ